MDTFSKNKIKWYSVEISECIIVVPNIFIRVGIGIDYRTIDNKCVLARKKNDGGGRIFQIETKLSGARKKSVDVSFVPTDTLSTRTKT